MILPVISVWISVITVHFADCLLQTTTGGLIPDADMIEMWYLDPFGDVGVHFGDVGCVAVHQHGYWEPRLLLQIALIKKLLQHRPNKCFLYN